MILRQVQNGEFPTPRALDPAIDRALEAVCLEAMATKPEERYPSPRALAEDVERWTADEPVAAWREPWARRVQRWARRNRTVVMTATAAVLVALLGTGAVLAVQNRANHQLHKANVALKASNAALDAANAQVMQANADLAKSNERFLRQFVQMLERQSLPTLGPADRYNLACAHALLAGIAADRGSDKMVARKWSEAERAVQWLHRAVSVGFRDLDYMRRDSDLDTLRSRSDFQLLLMDLAMPSDPFAR